MNITKTSSLIIMGVSIISLVIVLSIIRKPVRSFDDIPIHHDNYTQGVESLYMKIPGPSWLNHETLDQDLIKLYPYGGELGDQYSPFITAEFILALLPHVESPKAHQVLVANLNYLQKSANKTSETGSSLPYNFDFPIHNAKAPWYSSMAQIRGALALWKGGEALNNPQHKEAAKALLIAVFEENQSMPLSKNLEQGLWLKEYPAFDFHVLDGTLVAISGLHAALQLIPDTDPDKASFDNLLQQSLIGFKANAHCFSTGFGAVFYSDERKNIASQGYYDIIMNQLYYLAKVDPDLNKVIADYSTKEMSTFDKIAVYYVERYYKKSRKVTKACVR